MTRPADDAAWRRLLDAASAPYRGAGQFAWRFARGKLGMDPVFRHLLATGLLPPGARVLDIGCGQGLLASLLHEVDRLAPQPGAWPVGWAPAPRGAHVTGIELMQRDVDRARAALGSIGTFICGDMCTTPYPPVDAVVILDVLHYVDHAEQDKVLTRVREALRPGGRLLLRIGDMQSRRGFAVSQWVDRVVTRVRGHQVAPTFGRSLAEWIATLQRLGFRAQAQPMSQGTPFANVLLVAETATVASASVSAQAA